MISLVGAIGSLFYAVSSKRPFFLIVLVEQARERWEDEFSEKKFFWRPPPPLARPGPECTEEGDRDSGGRLIREEEGRVWESKMEEREDCASFPPFSPLTRKLATSSFSFPFRRVSSPRFDSVPSFSP